MLPTFGTPPENESRVNTIERSSMRYAAHKACAHPYVISWVIGTLALWILLSWNLFRSVSYAAVFEHWTAVPLLIISYAATAGFGMFVGVIGVSWAVVPRCRRFNGAPYKVEQRVKILSGPQAGTEALIVNISRGQGGEPVLSVVVDTPPDSPPKQLYLEDYSVLRLPSPASC